MTLHKLVLRLAMALSCVIGLAGCSSAPAASDTASNPVNGHGPMESHLLNFRRGMAVPRFVFTDHRGAPFTPERMQGKWSVVMFGYTHCPDFCPATLMTINAALGELAREHAELAGRVSVIFISVDPFRDSTDDIAKYVTHFNSGFVGVTGSVDELHRFTKLLDADYSYDDPDTGKSAPTTAHAPAGEYVVSHGSNLYLFDEQTRYVRSLSPPFTTRRIASALEYWMQNPAE